MLSFLNKKIPRQYSFINWTKGLIGSQIKRYFLRFVKIFYSKIYTPGATKPTKGKLLIISEVGGLGDAILFRRTVEAIRNNYDIYLITKQYHLPVYKDIIPKEKIFTANNLLHLFNIAKRLKKENFNLLFLHELSVASFAITLFFFKDIPFKIGAFAEQGKGFLNKNLIASDYKNVLDLYSDLTRYLGGQYKLHSFDEYKQPLIQKNNQVLIHIGSGSLCKNWRIRNFIELFKMFDGANINYKIIGNKQDLEIIKNFSNQLDIKPIIIKSFDELVKMILNSEIVICHNTSILHLAFALDIKTISFNSKGGYTWWNPYKDFPDHRHYAFNASNKECGYSQQIKSLLIEKNKYGCSLFDSIKPQEVFLIVKKMLNQSSSQ